ncbi:MAG: hypothetical protein JNK82_43550 [Myxococcaceae bacterium]|nr:hypothetical protein [Myxococcaceae bacterium]
MAIKTKQLQELVLQSLEHELGGVKVYETALDCVINEDLEAEWERYLAETKRHAESLTRVCEALGLDAGRETPGRKVVRHNGVALVEAMKLAMTGGDASAAELVACECVVLAETKDHADWALLGQCADALEEGKAKQALLAAYQEIEDQEDEHLYHSRGWCRELWLQALGLPAVLPPPEETKRVRTAIGAAMAEQAADNARRLAVTVPVRVRRIQ